MALALTPGYRPIHDDASYARDALSLLRAGRYPMHRLPHGALQVSAYRPPGWPLALWGLWRVTGPSVPAARVLLAALGAAAAVLAALLARRLWSRREGLAAGALVACCPLLVAVGASLESETLFTVLLLAALLAALRCRQGGRRAWAAAAGLAVGLACLTRTNGLLLVPAVAWLAASGALRRRRAWVAAVAVALVAALAIAPWTARNAHALGRFVPVSTETGNTLAGTYDAAAARHQGQWLEPRRTGAYRALYRRYGAGAALDGPLSAAVARWVAAHPAYPLRVAGWNADRLVELHGPRWAGFSLWTMSLGTRAGRAVGASTAALVALGLLGLAGLLRARAPASGPLALAAGALLAPCLLVSAELRLAAPALAVLALPAAWALCAAAGRLRRPGRARREPARSGSEWQSR
jgi:4-amino-4-deoxy-L-arabinose transferase-like glycosyltransferase